MANSRKRVREEARIYESRPCYIGGESLYWAVTGSTMDGTGAGVMAWCWDEADANDALRALKATGDYTALMVENLRAAS